MRVLLIAYEFPPVLAAQSIRWYYLANGLAQLKVEVDVLAPALPDLWSFQPDFRPEVNVFRCFPGPFVSLSGWLKQHIVSGYHNSSSTSPALASVGLPEYVYRAVRRVLDNLLFPDVRTEWFPFAWRTAKKLYARRGHEVVISSHEPGVDLLLGAAAKRRWNIPWIADLADPVLTPYTPKWRLPIDRRFERFVCENATKVLTTADRTGALLTERHNLPDGRIELISQGFDLHSNHARALTRCNVSGRKFLLVFTGSLYRDFRNPTELFCALQRTPKVHLAIAGHMHSLDETSAEIRDQIQILGKVSHDDALSWQRNASVLVSIGNMQSYQVPGKIYEYLGAGRPILHIITGPDDPIPVLLEKKNRGISVSNNRDKIAEALAALQKWWLDGDLDRKFDLSETSVAEYSWASQSEHLYGIIDEVHQGSVS